MLNCTPFQTLAVTLLCFSVSRFATAQSPSATLEVPLVAPSTEPKRLDEPGDAQRDRQPHELTYQGDTFATGNGRSLHYRVEPTPDAQPRESTSAGLGTAARAIDDGAMVPYTLTARINKGQSWVRALGGYDTAAGSARLRSAAETAVTRWFALRVDYEHGPGGSGLDDRVGLGGRFQVLDQSRHGIDLGFAAFYQPKDFRSEGNIVGGLMLGRRFGRLGLFGSALVGSDPEGDDQDTDGRLSMLYRATDALSVGLDNRFHYVLSTDQKRFGTITTDWELQLEPAVIINWGPIAILSEAGLSALQNSGPFGMPENRRVVRTGVIAMAGAGAVF